MNRKMVHFVFIAPVPAGQSGMRMRAFAHIRSLTLKRRALMRLISQAHKLGHATRRSSIENTIEQAHVTRDQQLVELREERDKLAFFRVPSITLSIIQGKHKPRRTRIFDEFAGFSRADIDAAFAEARALLATYDQQYERVREIRHADTHFVPQTLVA